jgi:glycosyltransferase involved in cell wall biosynthesis
MSNDKNILMIGPDISSKGGMSSVIKLFQENSSLSEKIIYLSSYKYKNPFIQIFFFWGFLTKYLFYLMTDNNIKLIHIHTASNGSFFRKSIIFYIAKFFKKKVIMNVHPVNFVNFYNKSPILVKKIIENILNNSDSILVLSEAIKSKVSGICQNKNIQVLYNPIEVKEIVRKDNEKINILFLGRLCEAKGVYDILEATKITQNNNFIINLYGDGNINEFKTIIKNNNIEDKILIKDWISGEEKDIVFEQSDIYLLPSHHEGLPMSILEAMAYGLPIISTPVGGIPDAVEDGVNGFLIQPGDSHALAEKIDILVNNKELREKMGQESYRIAKEKFDIKTITKQLHNIYNQLI